MQRGDNKGILAYAGARRNSDGIGQPIEDDVETNRGYAVLSCIPLGIGETQAPLGNGAAEPSPDAFANQAMVGR